MTGLQPLASDTRIRERGRRVFDVVRRARTARCWRRCRRRPTTAGIPQRTARPCRRRRTPQPCGHPRATCRRGGHVPRSAERHRRGRRRRPRRPPRTGRRCAPPPRRARCPTTATTAPAPSPPRTARAGQRWCCATTLRRPVRCRTSPRAGSRQHSVEDVGAPLDRSRGRRVRSRTTSAPFPGTDCPVPETATRSSADRWSSPASGPEPAGPREVRRAAVARVARESTTRAARCSKCERAGPAVAQTSASGASGFASIQSR